MKFISRDHEVPTFRAPPGGCDTHFHIFGPQETYPVASRARYAPPLASLDDYLAHARAFGIDRMVVVQPSAYGRDNRCTLDTLNALGSRARAIVDIDESVSIDEINSLHEKGVRGVRINVSPIAAYEPDLPNCLLPRIDMLAGKLAGRGWLLEFLGPDWLIHALMPRMRTLEVNFVIDHLGMVPASQGPHHARFQALVDLVKTTERCWIKLTGIYRFATAPDYVDAAPMVAELIRAAPDRLIWGSDYPHLSFADRVDTTQLFNLLADWLPTDALRRRVLCENPGKLFGFDATMTGQRLSRPDCN